jgi:imidazolonepropionase-like amidohydrolase
MMDVQRQAEPKRHGDCSSACVRAAVSGSLFVALLLGASCSTTPSAEAPGRQYSLAFVGVAIVNVSNGELLTDQTVLIEGSRITGAGPRGRVAVPRGARVVDARGKYLIPGLWDMHVHSATSVEWHFPLFLAHGVTGVRNMHTSVDTALELTQAIKRRLASGALPGPRFIANGAILDGPVPLFAGAVRLGDAAAARPAVDSLAAAGADFLKVYQRLSRETYFAIAEHAKRRGIPFAGHVPGAVRAAEAADAGQRSIEHILALNLECSSQGDSIRAVQRARPPANYEDFLRLQHAFARSWSLEHCAPAIAALRRNATWFVPTMVIYWTEAHGGSALADRTTVSLTPPETLRQWDALDRDIPAWRREADATILEAGMATVRAFHDAGVPLLAGTDVGNPLLVPGYSLHRELELLVASGLTPLDALRTATLNPARFLEATDSLGTIASGKLADLVLLDANPLVEIRNTQRIAGVVLNGCYLDRNALDALRMRAPEEPRLQSTGSAATATHVSRVPMQLDDGWAVASPQDAGLDTWLLDSISLAIRRAGHYSSIHALLIARDSQLVTKNPAHGVRFVVGDGATSKLEFSKGDRVQFTSPREPR